MSQVWKCDICGKYEPRSIRRIRAENPDVSDKPLNKEKYYAFNLFHGDFCDECLHEIERAISNKIYEMRQRLKAETITEAEAWLQDARERKDEDKSQREFTDMPVLRQEADSQQREVR